MGFVEISSNWVFSDGTMGFYIFFHQKPRKWKFVFPFRYVPCFFLGFHIPKLVPATKPREAPFRVFTAQGKNQPLPACNLKAIRGCEGILMESLVPFSPDVVQEGIPG